jgi:transposase
MAYTYIGVDLSKDWLDVFHPDTGARRVGNTAPKLRAFLDGLGKQDLLVFEATSLCDGLLQREATAAGRLYHRLNPLHGWHFGRSLNLPKTDRVDARMLARIGAERALEPSPGFDAVRAELAELVGRRDQIERMRTQEINRSKKTWSQDVAEDIALVREVLDARLKAADRRIAAFIKAHPALADKAKLLRSAPGVGPVVCATLLAHMPELGRVDRRAAASLAGLAPRARESGKWRGRRFTGDGRRHVRRALYMAALAAMRSGSPFAQTVDRLRERGKPGRLITIAMARKLIVIANALIRDGEPFMANPEPT